jgi:dihydropyrimidinase
LLQALKERISQADGCASVDYALHMTLTDDRPDTLGQLDGVFAAGCTSFKTYLAYEGFRLSDHTLLTILDAVHRRGGLVMVHAENDAIITYRTAQLMEAGKTGPCCQPLSRPEAAEREAIHRALALAEVVGAAVYIVHISTGAGARELHAARRRGVDALGETCPQYLLLTERELDRPGLAGAAFVCSPPLRTARDNEALWQALADGTLQTVGTDHCPFFYHGQKDCGWDDFSQIPGGLPGIESRLALLHTFGVRRGLLSLGRWVEVCSTAPAKLFGLYPRKGCLEPGSDADIVLFDPQQKRTVSTATLHEHVDYTPYDGFQLEGVPVAVFLRGERLVQGETIAGPPGTGKYLRCEERR